MPLVRTSVVLLLILVASCSAQPLAASNSLANDWEYEGTTDIRIDARFQFPVSDKLYGIFFEEVKALYNMQEPVLAFNNYAAPPHQADAASLSASEGLLSV